jgi:hypothetical protein
MPEHAAWIVLAGVDARLDDLRKVRVLAQDVGHCSARLLHCYRHRSALKAHGQSCRLQLDGFRCIAQLASLPLPAIEILVDD